MEEYFMSKSGCFLIKVKEPWRTTTNHAQDGSCNKNRSKPGYIFQKQWLYTTWRHPQRLWSSKRRRDHWAWCRKRTQLDSQCSPRRLSFRGWMQQQIGLLHYLNFRLNLITKLDIIRLNLITSRFIEFGFPVFLAILCWSGDHCVPAVEIAKTKAQRKCQLIFSTEPLARFKTMRIHFFFASDSIQCNSFFSCPFSVQWSQQQFQLAKSKFKCNIHLATKYLESC